MFTGLIQETGKIIKAGPRHPIAAPQPVILNETASGRVKKLDESSSRTARITIEAATIPSLLKLGDSVSVSGVCLTAVEVGGNHFSADLASETLQRTSLGSLKEGSCVNLELPVRAGDRMGGHMVQGHVDGVGQLLGLEKIKRKED